MLKYRGKRAIIGVPARDLTDEEVERYGRARLLASGLYYAEKPKKQKEQDEQPAEE